MNRQAGQEVRTGAGIAVNMLPSFEESGPK